MEKKTRVTSPRYQQIAADIASKIVNGHYQVGDKIYARSAIASQYSVSSETARRAISILTDLNIVETIKGSGVKIVSFEKAVDFIRQYEDVQSVNNIKKEILHSIAKQEKELDHLRNYVTSLIDKTDRFRSINPFLPFEIEIQEETPYLNHTISELNFWHKTAATIIAEIGDFSAFSKPNKLVAFFGVDLLLNNLVNLLVLRIKCLREALYYLGEYFLL